MPMSMSPGNIIQLQAWCTDVEQASVNSYHYRCISVGPTPATDRDVTIAFDNAIAADYKALLVNSATYNGVVGRLKNVLPLPSPQLSNANTGAGTAGAVGIPRQASGLLSFKTDVAGARGRGRAYIPFPSTSDNAGGGGATAGYGTKLDNLWATLSSFVTVASGGRSCVMEFIIWHQKGSGSPAEFPIISHVSSLAWATIKKRGSFGKANSSPFA